MSSMLYKEIFNFSEWLFPNPNFIWDVFQIYSFMFTTDFVNFQEAVVSRYLFCFLLQKINFLFSSLYLFWMNYSHQGFSLYLVNIWNLGVYDRKINYLYIYIFDDQQV